MSQVSNDAGSESIFKVIARQYFGWDRKSSSWMYMLTENTIISEENNDGQDISNYSGQYVQIFLENSIRVESKGSFIFIFVNQTYLYFLD